MYIYTHLLLLYIECTDTYYYNKVLDPVYKATRY